MKTNSLSLPAGFQRIEKKIINYLKYKHPKIIPNNKTALTAKTISSDGKNAKKMESKTENKTAKVIQEKILEGD